MSGTYIPNSANSALSAGSVETISLASASRLVDINTNAIGDGVNVKVLSVEDIFQLVKAPSAALIAATDGITVVQPVANAGHRWIRLELGSIRWRTQTTWFVDPVNGNDENTGAILGLAIRTMREFSRRMGPTGEIVATIDVTLTADAVAGDKLYLRELSVRPDAMFRFHGTVTLLDSGTFTAVTNLDSATQTPPSVVDAAQDFTAYLNRRLRITAGARLDACAFVSLVQAATTVRTSAWATNNVAAVPYSQAVVLVNPVIGDPYAVEQLPILREVEIQLSKTGQGAQGSVAVLFESIQIGNSSNDRFAAGQGTPNITIAKGIIGLNNFYARNLSVSIVDFVTSSSFHEMTLDCRAILMRGLLTFHAAGEVFLRDQSAVQGPSGVLQINNSAYCQVLSAFAFDSGTGITVEAESQVQFTGLMWGNNNTNFGINSLGRCTYVVKPTVTGLVSDTRVGGVNLLYAAIPVGPNALNGAMLAVRPT